MPDQPSDTEEDSQSCHSDNKQCCIDAACLDDKLPLDTIKATMQPCLNAGAELSLHTDNHRPKGLILKVPNLAKPSMPPPLA